MKQGYREATFKMYLYAEHMKHLIKYLEEKRLLFHPKMLSYQNAANIIQQCNQPSKFYSEIKEL